jgi:hypothetical protein
MASRLRSAARSVVPLTASAVPQSQWRLRHGHGVVLAVGGPSAPIATAE